MLKIRILHIILMITILLLAGCNFPAFQPGDQAAPPAVPETVSPETPLPDATTPATPTPTPIPAVRIAQGDQALFQGEF